MGVSASAICPGLISDAGMWADVQADTGAETPKMQGATPAAKVGTAVIDAILKDKAELIVSARPVRPVLAAGSLFPRFMEWFLGSMAGESYKDAAVRDKARE